jgi:hypothetical protein
MAGVNKKRENWTNAEWAKHLGVSASKIPTLKKIASNSYVVSVERKIDDSRWHFVLLRKHKTPRGAARLIPVDRGDKGFPTAEAAAKDANERIIPKLELTEFQSKINEVPPGILQFLKVKSM